MRYQELQQVSLNREIIKTGGLDEDKYYLLYGKMQIITRKKYKVYQRK